MPGHLLLSHPGILANLTSCLSLKKLDIHFTAVARRPLPSLAPHQLLGGVGGGGADAMPAGQVHDDWNAEEGGPLVEEPPPWLIPGQLAVLSAESGIGRFQGLKQLENLSFRGELTISGSAFHALSTLTQLLALTLWTKVG